MRNRPTTYRMRNDLTGKVFDMLTVISRAPPPVNINRTDVYWQCRCACGIIKVIRSEVLRDGRNKSCGCNQRLHWRDKHLTRKAAA